MGNKANEFIDIEFCYNGELGKLQQKTIDNKIFCSSLLQNDVITHEEWIETIAKINQYFIDEIQKVANRPFSYCDIL